MRHGLLFSSHQSCEPLTLLKFQSVFTWCGAPRTQIIGSNGPRPAGRRHDQERSVANSCCDRRPAGPESCRLPLIPQILELMRIAWWEACESMFVASSTQKENTPNGRRTDTLSITAPNPTLSTQRKTTGNARPWPRRPDDMKGGIPIDPELGERSRPGTRTHELHRPLVPVRPRHG